MLKLLVCLLACFASAWDLSAQMLIVDRSPSSGPNQFLGLPNGTQGFLADDFQVGAATENWVIDHIRLWAVPDAKATSPRGPGDLFKKISLYGGIAPETPSPNQTPAVDCDCHSLPALKTAVISPGSDSTHNPDVVISSSRQPDGREVWQIDFENLRWSVPGGTSIQFGLLAESRQVHGPDSSYTWYYLASPADGGQHLRVFSSAGKLQSSFGEESTARVNIQVWGHLMAKASIRPAGEKLGVILRSEPFLEASQVDTAGLPFGPRGDGASLEGCDLPAHRRSPAVADESPTLPGRVYKLSRGMPRP